MNKSDKIFVVFVFILSLAIYVFSDHIFEAITSDELQAVIYVDDQEYGRYSLHEDRHVTISGTLGDVVIEIADDRVRILTDTSPLHICSLQGWVDRAYVSLICLPNGVVVQIENARTTMEEPDVDSLTQ